MPLPLPYQPLNTVDGCLADDREMVAFLNASTLSMRQKFSRHQIFYANLLIMFYSALTNIMYI